MTLQIYYGILPERNGWKSACRKMPIMPIAPGRVRVVPKGNLRLYLAAVLALSLPTMVNAAVAADAVVPDGSALTATAASAVPTQAVTPVSATATATTDVPVVSEFVEKVPDPVKVGPMGPPVFAGLSIAEILIIGVVLLSIVSFARRRHRRRVGWGVMPERPSLWRRFAD